MLNLNLWLYDSENASFFELILFFVFPFSRCVHVVTMKTIVILMLVSLACVSAGPVCSYVFYLFSFVFFVGLYSILSFRFIWQLVKEIARFEYNS